MDERRKMSGYFSACRVWVSECVRRACVHVCVFMFVLCICELRRLVPLHTLSPPPPITSLPPASRRHPRRFSVPTPANVAVNPLRASTGRPCGDEHRKMRVIKGKIFLCPLIGGCRGNTRATSASNYFQTLRIERALPRTAGIARHTHTHMRACTYQLSHTFFRISRASPPSSPSNEHLRSPLKPPCAILATEGVDC